jgi:predicted nucleotidyltransferase
MERQQVLRILRSNRRQLERDFAVETLSLFGSVARGESTDSSDVDLLVEFSRPIGLLHLIQTEQYLESLLGVERVDLILRRAVLPELKEQIFAEALDAI